MSWSRYTIEEGRIQGTSIVAILLFFVSLYMHSRLVMFLSIFFLLIVFANHHYLKRVGEQFYYENIHEKQHHFIDGTGQWTLRFRNEGLPILKADLRIYFDPFVMPLGEGHESSHILQELSVPFSLYTNQNSQLVIPFTARKRGIAKIRKLEIHIPGLLGFGKMVLESKHHLKQDVVVYPNPAPVRGLAENMSSLQGTSAVSHSIYEDRLSNVGTRDYVSSDSFNRIHWKASARKQVLQTKIYENIAEKSWTVSLNILNGHSIAGNLEELLSCLTEFAYYAFKQQIPYSLCINVRAMGGIPFLCLPQGEGKEHLQKALEMLASINTESLSLPYASMLSFYQRHFTGQSFFLHAGIRTAKDNEMLLYEARKGTRIVELKMENDVNILSKLELDYKRRVRH